MPSILHNRSIVRVTGDDAAKFLQNLVTNDVYSEKPIYAMMLSPQGRFLFDMFIINTQGGFLLDISALTKDMFIQKLGMYKINLNVLIEDMSGVNRVCYHSSSSGEDPMIHLRIMGPLVKPEDDELAHEDDELAHEDDELAHEDDGFLSYFKDPRYEKLGYRFITTDNIVDDNSYMEDKYKYTIPDGGLDLLYDKAMPPEYGAEELYAISYNKGCYVGQEVISRTKTQGQVRKKIYKITASDKIDHIAHGTEITSYGTKIGIFCSGLGNTGIALIREENIDPTEFVPMLENIEIDVERAEWYPKVRN